MGIGELPSGVARTFMRGASRLLACMGLVWAAAAGAELSAQIQSGLDWLQTQLRADGSLAGEPFSIATPAQTRAESLETLSALRVADESLTALVAAGEDDSTELLARRVLSLAAAEHDASDIAARLRQRQNPDGGFGDAAGARSNVLDTAWVLLSLKVCACGDGAVLGAALGYLTAAINDDGGYAAPAPNSQTFVTAYALLALEAYRDVFDLGTPSAGAQAWLQQQASSPSAQTLINAVAVLALSRATSDVTRYAGAVEALRNAQAADGSWNGDPYLTSLALRALASLENPPPVENTGRVQGQVVDAQSRAPIEGASVALAGLLAPTSASGEFVFNAITAGAYTVHVSKEGYAALEVPVSVMAGSTSVLGVIALNPAPTAAILRGSVHDAASGAALAGASVTIVRDGAQIGGAVTSASGTFEIAGIVPGPGAISVQLAGYRAITVSAELAAGTTYTFFFGEPPKPGQGAQTIP